MESITNMAGQTFTVGQRVKHKADGWTGTITGIRETQTVDLLLVQPDEGAALGGYDREYGLNPEAAARAGRATFCRPRDEGRSMGNYWPLDENGEIMDVELRDDVDYEAGEPTEAPQRIKLSGWGFGGQTV